MRLELITERLSRVRPSSREPFSRRTVAIVRALALCGLLVSLTVSTYYWMHDAAGEKVLRSFDYRGKRGESYVSLRPEWRARVGSTGIALLFATDDAELRRQRIAQSFAIGFFLTGALYVLISRRAAPIMMLGTFAALYYGSTPRAEDTWYPWDMPALVFGALTLCLALRRRAVWLAVAILIAVPFKETLIVMALYYLFFDQRSLRWRLAWTAGVASASLLLRAAIERAIGGAYEHANFLHVHGRPARELRLFDNLNYIFDLHPNHVLLVNAGMWLIVFLIPSRDSVLSGFRLIVAALYAGLLLAGSYNEFRVFLEVLPGSLLLLHGLFERDALASEPTDGLGSGLDP